MSSEGDGFRAERVLLGAGPINYREAGTGPPLVFVHGALANGRLWSGVAERLSRSHRCIVPDWPMGSHPEAMAADADLSPTGMARIIADFLAALDVEDVTLVGNDSGGAICQLLVTTNPSRIGRLVLTNCDCFDKFPPPAFKGMVVAARVPGVYTAMAQALRLRAARNLPNAYGRLTTSAPDDELLRSFVEPQIRDAGIRRDGRKFVAAMDPAHTLAAAAKLPDLELPTILVWGSDDRFFTPADGRRLEATIPGARFIEVAEASTFVSIDRPDAVAEAIAEFIPVPAVAAPETA